MVLTSLQHIHILDPHSLNISQLKSKFRTIVMYGVITQIVVT